MGRTAVKAIYIHSGKATQVMLLPDDAIYARWEDRVGDEIEQTGSYSAEEFDIARVSALEHGGLDDYAD